MFIGGLENDVQVYCLCEHHEELRGPTADLTAPVRERLHEARLRQRR